MTLCARLSLPLVTVDTASTNARDILDGVRDEVGSIPNMYAAMANAPGLFEAYLYSYTQFRLECSLTPLEQEVILLALSVANGNPYSVAMHSGIATTVVNVSPDVVNAIRDGEDLLDARLRALVGFTYAMFFHRGRPSPIELKAFLDAGYSQKNVLDIILAIAITTLSNYTNHVFETDLDGCFREFSWIPPP
ncbi:carboxymuconolactone decarboxylase family protein [Cupriavidus necator]|uniref:carboxymuconolactone decarboxylase family protein n=1 Tax=Cupriavidus necator TaxID=106590 RepID=UPI003ECE3E04